MDEIVPFPVSAGGLVVRAGFTLEVLLARQSGKWRIPKGMRERGELLPVTAMREVLEETGCSAGVFAPLTVASWTYTYKGVECHETCHFYVMSDLGIPLAQHDTESERVGWFSLNDAPDVLAYAEEADAARELVGVLESDSPVNPWVLASGIPGAVGSRARGRIVFTRSDALAALSDSQDLVICLPDVSPADAHLVAGASAVVSLRGGPASHIAVVATALGIPCVLAPTDLVTSDSTGVASGVRAIPRGARVEIDGTSGDIRVVPADGHASTKPSAPPLDQSAAFAWAEGRARVLGLPKPVNWKLFKRDLVGTFCPQPPARRFPSPWLASDIADYALTLTGGTVRCSAFPRTIACHATSVVLDDAEPEHLVEVLGQLDPHADLEVFIEQARDQICWRLVRNGDMRVLEGGVGQAMYVFEAERGSHSTVSARWTASSPVRLDNSGSDLGAVVERFLLACGGELEQVLGRIAKGLDIEVFAIEGYHRDGTGSFVVCDMDLPIDRAFMG